MQDYSIVLEDGQDTIDLIRGPYKGVSFRYGKVELVPDEEKDELCLRFEYNIIRGEPSDVGEFVQYIGRLLNEMICEQVAKNEVVYTGGVDE